VIYIAPLKALVKERVEDWTRRFGGILGYKVVELTGDAQPDHRRPSSPLSRGRPPRRTFSSWPDIIERLRRPGVRESPPTDRPPGWAVCGGSLAMPFL